MSLDVAGPLPRPPYSSFGHGAAGVAYFLLRSGSPGSAAEWMTAAEAGIRRPGAFTGDAPVFPDERAAIPASLYFGEAGVWCCGALVAAAQDDSSAVERCVDRFAAVAEACPAERSDAASGAAGLLLGAAVMIEQLGARDRLTSLGEALADRLSRRAAGWDPDAPKWLGAAHGWSGIAQALLRWSQATATPPGPEVVALLAAFRDERLPSGLWPRRSDDPEVWPGWCHGSAGWAQLWTLAWEVLGDDDFLALAEVPSTDAVAIDGAGAGLCCGEAGSAYAALAMYRATEDATWLGHARRLAERAARTLPDEYFPEHSLWQGDLGVALLLTELEAPASAAMPLYRRH